MIHHDTAHEERQNAAIRMLAAAVSQVAAHNGHSGLRSLLIDIDAALSVPKVDKSPALDAVDEAPVVTEDSAEEKDESPAA
jgi:hypothetical protein